MSRPKAETPAVALINPKYPHNVGAIQRACSCFGMQQLWFTGNRVSLEATEGYRLPREERMKGYRDVSLIQWGEASLFDQFERDVTVVAVEVRRDTESLVHFEHPEKALYVFGPEDGGLDRVHTRHCHRFVMIPAGHCLNLAAAVYVVLYDRVAKLGLEGLTNEWAPWEALKEHRGWLVPDAERG